MTKWIMGGVVAFLVCASVEPAVAQKADKPDAFAEALFDPQLVLQHAQQIGLTSAQRRTILDEIKATQVALAPLQADMTEPAMELVELLGQSKVDEARVLAKTEQVLRIENEVKKKQTALLVRIKNALTPEQQAKLRELRKSIRDGEDAVEVLKPFI